MQSGTSEGIMARARQGKLHRRRLRRLPAADGVGRADQRQPNPKYSVQRGSRGAAAVGPELTALSKQRVDVEAELSGDRLRRLVLARERHLSIGMYGKFIVRNTTWTRRAAERRPSAQKRHLQPALRRWGSGSGAGGSWG
jgi:hypothetical protein